MNRDHGSNGGHRAAKVVLAACLGLAASVALQANAKAPAQGAQPSRQGTQQSKQAAQQNRNSVLPSNVRR